VSDPGPSLAVFWHPDVLRHDTGAGVFEAAASSLMAADELHPESAARILNIKSMLERGPLAGCVDWPEVSLHGEDELELVHTAEYLDGLRHSAAAGGGRFTSTTVLGPDSWPALLAAASAAMDAAREAMARPGVPAYALVRPPGHHAQPACADGYCFVNNTALAAETALAMGAKRVAVIDFDVHHGNGTQECFWTRSDVLTISLHMDHGSWGPSHPQTGAVSEFGQGPGEGFNLNLALPYGTGDAGYVRAMGEVAAPLVCRYQPDLVIGAIGQDASQFDPNGRQLVTMNGFRTLGEILRSVADRTADGRLALIQEGGYNASYSAFCLHATLCGVLGVPTALDDPLAYMPDREDGVAPVLAQAVDLITPRWGALVPWARAGSTR
jgi:acetoin utilization deacetylase AcuC-like enzyme